MNFPSVFNPYTDRCPHWDLPDAPKIRERNLACLMEALEGQITSIWFGRDLGYLGGRRTGLALTDEAHLPIVASTFSAEHVRRATKGPAASERTASTVWTLIQQIDAPPFLWNIFPFHPYAGGDHDSNRCHSPSERRACAVILNGLLDWAQPDLLVAIGNDARKGLEELRHACTSVRHPSYGGTKEFISGITSLYQLTPKAASTQKELF